MDMDPTRTYPIGAPWTHHSSHRSNFTNAHSTFPVHDHSFSCMHSYIHPIHPSIAYAIVASQRFASHHEAVVVSFDMSANQPRFEGQPTKGSRPPRVKQSQGRKTKMSPSGLARPRSEADRDISTFLVRSKPRAKSIESPSRRGQRATQAHRTGRARAVGAHLTFSPLALFDARRPQSLHRLAFEPQSITAHIE